MGTLVRGRVGRDGYLGEGEGGWNGHPLSSQCLFLFFSEEHLLAVHEVL